MYLSWSDVIYFLDGCVYMTFTEEFVTSDLQDTYQETLCQWLDQLKDEPEYSDGFDVNDVLDIIDAIQSGQSLDEFLYPQIL